MLLIWSKEKQWALTPCFHFTIDNDVRVYGRAKSLVKRIYFVFTIDYKTSIVIHLNNPSFISFLLAQGLNDRLCHQLSLSLIIG